MSESRMNKAVLSCRNLGKSYEEGPESVKVLSGLNPSCMQVSGWPSSAAPAPARVPC